MKSIIVYSVIFIVFVSCQKKNEVPYEGKMYYSIKFNNESPIMVEDDYIFVAGTQRGDAYFGSYIFNTNSLIPFTFTQLKASQFTIRFTDIPYDNITVGSYNFSNDCCSKGVRIQWMSEDYWYDLFEVYKTGEVYQNCLATRPSENSCAYDLNSDLFFNSWNKNQENNYLTVTKITEETSDFNGTTNPYPVKILEGNFKCLMMSKLDTSFVKQMEGNFRVRI